MESKYYKKVTYEKFYQSNNFGMVEVIARKPRKLKIRFLDTGNEGWFLAYNVVAGRVRDREEEQRIVKSRRNTWTSCKKEMESNSGLKFTAFKETPEKYKIVFDRTGYSTEVYKANADKGKVADPYEATLYGHGMNGLYDKSKPYWKQARLLWSNMIKRCYDPKYRGGYYGRVFVDERWKTFENFLEDLSCLENFDKWLEGQRGGETKYNLDKDFIREGNNVYSKNLCMFLTEFENKSLGKKGKKLNSNGEFTKTL